MGPCLSPLRCRSYDCRKWRGRVAGSTDGDRQSRNHRAERQRNRAHSAKTQIRISADVSAKIIALHVEEGEAVEEGQLLVELDRERFEAAVESAEALVRSAESNARLNQQNMLKAEKDYDRSRDVVSRKLESQAVLDQDEAAYEVEVARYQSALDQVEQAKAALKQARTDLSKTIVYSPMTGTISDLNKEQGEIAIGSAFQEDVILVVADLTEMEAQVNVDENDIVGVQIGQTASIQVDALFGETLKELSMKSRIPRTWTNRTARTRRLSLK